MDLSHRDDGSALLIGEEHDTLQGGDLGLLRGTGFKIASHLLALVKGQGPEMEIVGATRVGDVTTDVASAYLDPSTDRPAMASIGVCDGI